MRIPRPLIRLTGKFLFTFIGMGAMTPAALSDPQLVTKYGGISEYRLENGLKVLIFPEPASSTLTVNVTYLVGSRHEGYGETGMAHLLEHLVFKNTDKYSGKDGAKTPVQILNELGGKFNGTTSTDRTNYFISVPASRDNLDQLLSLEAERMGHSLLDPNDLWDAKQKRGEMTVVRNEFEADENRPISVTYKRLLGTAFDWHNYGNPTIGAKSDIENVGIDQIRAFYKKYYQPDNAVILIAGKLDEKETLALVDKHFASKQKPERVLRDTYTREPPQDGERTVTVRREGDTPLVIVGYKTPAGFGKDGVALGLLGQIMTDEPSGRLYKALVEKKLASKVAMFGAGDREPGISLTLALLPSGGNLEKTESVMLRELENVARNKITQEELDRAKKAALSQWDQMLSQPDHLGIALSEYIAQGDWKLFFVYRDLLEKVTREDVQKVAEKYYRTANRTIARFIPTKKPDAVSVAEAEDVNTLIASLKPDEDHGSGETFDTAPMAIEARVTRKPLSEQLQLALLPKKTRRGAVSAVIAVRLGNEKDLTNKGAVGYATGMMLSRGTKKYSRQALKDKLDSLQSEISVQGSAEVTYLVIKTKRKHLQEVLTLAHEILTEPTFPEGELEKFLAEAKTALEYSRSEPTTLARELLNKHLSPFPKGHVRYPLNTDETLAELAKIKRADIISFYKSFYGANGQISLVGDFDAKEGEQLLSKLFGSWPSQVPYERVKNQFFKVAALEKAIETPGKANAYLGAGLNIQLNDAHPDFPALFLANYMMGGGTLRSRLADRIRQKEGLSYGVSSSLAVASREPAGRWGASAIFNPANEKKVESALREEINKALKDGFTEDEVSLAKESIKQAMAVSRSSDERLATTMIEQLQDERTWAFQDQLEKSLAQLSADQVSAVFRQYIDASKISIVKGGDFNKVPKNSGEGH